MKYEAEALWRLQQRYELSFVQSPWFAFESSSRPTVQYCQPDGLLFVGEFKVVVCEIKYNHVVDAYFQLKEKYLPIVQKAFPHLKVSLCEVVKWYDKLTKFPCEIKLQPNPAETLPEDFAVHILNR